MRRRRAVVEHVAEMAAAAGAMDLVADHSVAAVARGFNGVRQRIVEAWPAGATLKLFLRHEQRLTASDACKRSVPFLIVQRATSRRFGAMTAQDVVLFGGEQAAPLLVGMSDWEFLAFHLRESPRILDSTASERRRAFGPSGR